MQQEFERLTQDLPHERDDEADGPFFSSLDVSQLLIKEIALEKPGG